MKINVIKMDLDKIEKNIDKIDGANLFIYFSLLRIFDENEIDNNEFLEKYYHFSDRFKEHIIKKLENGESIKR